MNIIDEMLETREISFYLKKLFEQKEKEEEINGYRSTADTEPKMATNNK